jgi:hypothetical protein
MDNKYEWTVWVDGSEANDHLLTAEQAEEVAGYWTDAGYEPIIERVTDAEKGEQ